MNLFTVMIIVFIVGYILIALEHPVKINKSATSLLLACLLWVFLAVGGAALLADPASFHAFRIAQPGSTYIDWLVHNQLVHTLGETAEIIFFLMGAMTIVELIDTMGGFKLITDKIVTTQKTRLMVIICVLTFFLSAILDNMTTAIIMVAVLHKLVGHKKERWIFSSMVILAANAGGTWSPMGDVTTIMLWVAGKISAWNIIKATFLASLVSIIIPMIVISFFMKGNVERPEDDRQHLNADYNIPQWESRLFLFLGIGLLFCVPVFKTLTHLPPYLGMLGVLGILWVTSEIIHRHQTDIKHNPFAINAILSRIDVTSILFFLGILMAVGALSTAGHLSLLAQTLDKMPVGEPGKYYIINLIIGLFSSVIDNVPLVAGAMGMYAFPMDHYFWEMLAYCAGTGGSILIIGSAAGVAVMGMEKTDFIWYLKNISWIALIGYFAGAGVFVLEKSLRESHAQKEEPQRVQVAMNEISIRDYLENHTFYIVEDRKGSDMQDSSTIRFIGFDTDKPISYYGTKITTFSQRQRSMELYNQDVNICRGNITLGNPMGDTLVPVLFGNRQLIVSQSGAVYFVTPNGPFELKRMN